MPISGRAGTVPALEPQESYPPARSTASAGYAALASADSTEWVAGVDAAVLQQVTPMHRVHDGSPGFAGDIEQTMEVVRRLVRRGRLIRQSVECVLPGCRWVFEEIEQRMHSLRVSIRTFKLFAENGNRLRRHNG